MIRGVSIEGVRNPGSTFNEQPLKAALACRRINNSAMRLMVVGAVGTDRRVLCDILPAHSSGTKALQGETRRTP